MPGLDEVIAVSRERKTDRATRAVVLSTQATLCYLVFEANLG